jgi:hypothetical protein
MTRADVVLENEGDITLFWAASVFGREWMDDYAPPDQSPWLAGVLLVASGPAGDLAEAMRQDGLVLAGWCA